MSSLNCTSDVTFFTSKYILSSQGYLTGELCHTCERVQMIIYRTDISDKTQKLLYSIHFDVIVHPSTVLRESL